MFDKAMGALLVLLLALCGCTPNSEQEQFSTKSETGDLYGLGVTSNRVSLNNVEIHFLSAGQGKNNIVSTWIPLFSVVPGTR